MGICTSCYTGVTSTARVKLVLLDGQLSEFHAPVKVVFVLAHPFNSFICNANDMDFDKVVKCMSDEEELRPGQLYFELPLSWLNRRLAADDMASLAVKAGTALMGSGGKVRCGCCVSKVDHLMFCDDDNEMMMPSWSGVGDRGEDVGNRGQGGRDRHGDGGNGRMLTRLEMIVEE